MIQQMTTRMEGYEKKLEQLPWQQGQQWQQQPSPWQQQQQPPTWQQQPQPWQQQPTWQQRYQSNWRGQQRGRYRGRGRGRGRGGPTLRSNNTNEEPKCWRCGEVGHYKIGCAKKLEPGKEDLNSNKSTQGEHA